MSAASRGLREVSACGDAAAVGRSHGDQAGDLIASLYAARLRAFTRWGNERDALTRAQSFLSVAGRCVPHLVEELAALGDAAGIGFERALFLQVASELEGSAASECSALGSVGVGEPFVGQNWDQPNAMRASCVLFRLRPADAPRLLMFGPAGSLGYLGVNGAGLGLVHTRLYLRPRKAGLAGYFVTRRLLECESVDAAVSWLSETPVSSTVAYLLADATGKLAMIELGAAGLGVTYGEALVHTNHYVAQWREIDDRVVTVLPDSRRRMQRLCDAFLPVGTEAAARAVMRDHLGRPQSICRHEGGGGLVTLASVIVRPGRREMLITDGPPCESSYCRYTMRRPPDSI